MSTPKPKVDYKVLQRWSETRRRTVLMHQTKDRKPGKILRFTRSSYQVQLDGSLRRI